MYKENLLKRMATAILFLGVLCSVSAQENDSLLTTLKSELKYNMESLRKQKTAPYFMSLRLQDSKTTVVQSNLGTATVESNWQRMVTPQIRVGSMELDNFKYNNQGSGATGANSRNGKGVLIPVSGRVIPAMRQAIWKEVLRRYDVALNNLEQAKSKTLTGQDNEDKAPCFSKAPVEKYYEADLPENQKVLDTEFWKNRLNKITRVFKRYADIESGTASLQFEVYRNYFVNTDGTEVVQNRRVYRVMMSASVMAPDGMTCPLNVDYLAYSPEEFPSEEKMLADAQGMVERLKALRVAPIADPYTGPAILSGPASGVFFHEIFGHRLEAHRLKSGGQTFKKMVGQKVLPETFSVYCDPTLQYYHGNALNGYYKYDDEGVKAQRVNNVTNGVLTNFLMSRVPLEGFPVSNGHGRMVGGNDPVSRQSNLIVETSKPYTDEQLRKMLIDEAKKQKKPYGYFFKTVTSGFTYTGEGGSLNSFNVTPIEVYRVYVDGRKDELVRGVDLIGTPLSMFSNITAASNSVSTFTGVCGAESGWVPVSASSPMIFVSKIETQRRQKDDQQARILPAPEVKEVASSEAKPSDEADEKIRRVAEDQVIFSAMNDELQRTSQKLFYPNYPKAFYVDYNMARSKEVSVSASLGGIVSAQKYPVLSVGGISLKVGDYQLTNDMKPRQMTNAYFSSEVDYDNIRREFWKASDMMYKYCLNSYAYKQNFLQNNPVPEEEKGIPDLLQMKANVNVDAQAPDTIAYQKMVKMAETLSAVFLQYPSLYDTKVNIHCKNNDIYRLNSEGIKQKVCNGYAEINATARVRTNSGAMMSDNYYRLVASDREFDEEALKKDIVKFAERLMEVKQATPVNDYYIGPMLFEDDAITKAVANQLYPIIVSRRSTQENSGMGSLIWSKRIIDKKLSLTQKSDMPSYKGLSLLGYVQQDADGVKPQPSLSIIKNGILEHLVCGRIPSLNSLSSTGNERFYVDPDRLMGTDVMPGVVALTSASDVTMSKMKQMLLKEAKAQGLTSAYILREPAGFTSCLYQVDVKTGKEQMVLVQDMPQLSKSDFMHVLNTSREDNVYNTIKNGVGTSIIAPRGVIVESIEKSLKKAKADKAFPVANPLEE